MGENVSLVGAGLKLLLLIFSWLFDRNKARKAKKKEVLNEAKEAIKTNDNAKLLNAFSKANRL